MKAPPVIKIKYENSGLAGSNTKKNTIKSGFILYDCYIYRSVRPCCWLFHQYQQDLPGIALIWNTYNPIAPPILDNWTYLHKISSDQTDLSQVSNWSGGWGIKTIPWVVLNGYLSLRDYNFPGRYREWLFLARSVICADWSWGWGIREQLLFSLK